MPVPVQNRPSEPVPANTFGRQIRGLPSPPRSPSLPRSACKRLECPPLPREFAPPASPAEPGLLSADWQQPEIRTVCFHPHSCPCARQSCRPPTSAPCRIHQFPCCC